MKSDASLGADGRTITVRIPMRLQRRRGRKMIVTPGGGQWAPSQRHVDSALVKAVARAHRWKRLIESGRFGSLTELADAERINRSYLCRVLRLTLIAPDIVEAAIDGRSTVQMAEMMGASPVQWDEQRRLLTRSGNQPPSASQH